MHNPENRIEQLRNTIQIFRSESAVCKNFMKICTTFKA